MNLFKRIHNLWNLSEYHAGQANEEYKEPGSEVSMIVKPPAKKHDIFFARVKEDPIKRLVNEDPHAN